MTEQQTLNTSQRYIFPIHDNTQKKGTKAVTGAVPL